MQRLPWFSPYDLNDGTSCGCPLGEQLGECVNLIVGNEELV